jgi:hypothetical protein
VEWRCGRFLPTAAIQRYTRCWTVDIAGDTLQTADPSSLVVSGAAWRWHPSVSLIAPRSTGYLPPSAYPGVVTQLAAVDGLAQGRQHMPHARERLQLHPFPTTVASHSVAPC